MDEPTDCHTGEQPVMAVTTNGPVLRAFKSVLEAANRPLSKETEDCSASVVRLLEHHHTTAQRPGMLLGKVQSGKTRAFVGAIAIAFDSGYDVAVVLTKTSKPLAAQTIRRLQQDLAPAIKSHLLLTFDAAGKIGALNQWEQGRKLIFVAKKHPKNLENLNQALLKDHPGLRDKRVLVIDDEADFASVGYERRQGSVQVRRVQTLINTLRAGLPKAVYLEVTATPYSLYLQPADIQVPAAGSPLPAIRPAFTKRVPVHSGYIGGEFYFDEAQQSGSVASFVHVPVPDAELAQMRQSMTVADDHLLDTPDLHSLRRALITFIIAGVLRHHDEAASDQPERLFSFIVHLERLRGAHADQLALAQRLIERLRTANLAANPVAAQVQDAHEDLRVSRRAAKLPTPSLTPLRSRIGDAFASVTTEVVNSDAQLERLLDDTGQLRQRSPFNIYIGGQSLDRGVTIANVIGFFYGRDPRVAQQDTTIQHCRMYGDRPRGDLAVTRFYTSNGIHARMRRMHEFDKMLWDQLREHGEHGEQVDAPGDVVFLQRDTTGGVSFCSPNKVMLSRIQWISPGGELVPRPFSTVSDQPDPPAVQRVVARLRAFGKASAPFQMSVDQACELLDAVCSLVRIDDGWDWDLDALKDGVRYLATSNPDAAARDRVFGLYTLGNRIRKWNDTAQSDPQRAPYSATTEAALRSATGDSPALAFYHNVGDASAGWRGSPFVWPVLFVPAGTRPVVFANNRRIARRRHRTL
jgi:hypothetical protein